MTSSNKAYDYYKNRKFDPIFWFLFIILLRGIICIFDKLLWLCFSHSVLKGNKRQQEMSKKYEHSAHIMNVYARGTNNLLSIHDETNFLCLHERYVHPKYILKNDNVILMDVDQKCAYFCISDENVDTCHSSVGPFLWGNNFVSIKKLLILDINHFHRLAKVRGNPFEKDNLNITIIHMTMRCGSTLLGQILEKVPRTKVMSEPKPFAYVGSMYLTGKISYIEYQHLLDSTFRLQCKKQTGIDHIVMKWWPNATPTIPFLKEKYPNLNLVFNTRNLKPTHGSVGKIFEALLPISARLSIVFKAIFFDDPLICIDYDDIEWWKIYRKRRFSFDKDIERAKFLFFNWWGPIEMYRKMKNKYVATILYEDLLKEPKNEIQQLFNSLGISNEFLDLSMEALKTNSQQGLFGKKGSSKTNDQTEALCKLDSIFKQFNVPFSSDGTLEQLKNLLK